ncbi:uncharacterized protein [Drosophila bipectinata]|uniref:uncharacterized protein n=1 Tax=Drosophila bipectinata TaxID=42026 RepID=UPI001C89C741|nr:uncharacterized protein LOC108121765 [Drosophila bipectinata]
MLAILTASSSGGVLDKPISSIKTKFLNQTPLKEGHRFLLEKANSSQREEMGVLKNPGTLNEQLVAMVNSSYDVKTDSATMYNVDTSRYEIKNRTLSSATLKSFSG